MKIDIERKPSPIDKVVITLSEQEARTLKESLKQYMSFEVSSLSSHSHPYVYPSISVYMSNENKIFLESLISMLILK